MKVYLLLEDNYDGIEEVVGIYTTRELAEAVKAERRQTEDRIEERDMDERTDWRNGSVYCVELTATATESTLRHATYTGRWRHPAEAAELLRFVGADGLTFTVASQSAISMEHAESVARAAVEEWRRSR